MNDLDPDLDRALRLTRPSEDDAVPLDRREAVAFREEVAAITPAVFRALGLEAGSVPVDVIDTPTYAERLIQAEATERRRTAELPLEKLTQNRVAFQRFAQRLSMDPMNEDPQQGVAFIKYLAYRRKLAVAGELMDDGTVVVVQPRAAEFSQKMATELGATSEEMRQWTAAQSVALGAVRQQAQWIPEVARRLRDGDPELVTPEVSGDNAEKMVANIDALPWAVSWLAAMQALAPKDVRLLASVPIPSLEANNLRARVGTAIRDNGLPSVIRKISAAGDSITAKDLASPDKWMGDTLGVRY